jgi:hypothetical protein
MPPEPRISISLNESVAKLHNLAHSNGDADKGFAAAVFDIRHLMSDLHVSTRVAP